MSSYNGLPQAHKHANQKYIDNFAVVKVCMITDKRTFIHEHAFSINETSLFSFFANINSPFECFNDTLKDFNDYWQSLKRGAKLPGRTDHATQQQT